MIILRIRVTVEQHSRTHALLIQMHCFCFYLFSISSQICKSLLTTITRFTGESE